MSKLTKKLEINKKTIARLDNISDINGGYFPLTEAVCPTKILACPESIIICPETNSCEPTRDPLYCPIA